MSRLQHVDGAHGGRFVSRPYNVEHTAVESVGAIHESPGRHWRICTMLVVRTGASGMPRATSGCIWRAARLPPLQNRITVEESVGAIHESPVPAPPVFTMAPTDTPPASPRRGGGLPLRFFTEVPAQKNKDDATGLHNIVILRKRTTSEQEDLSFFLFQQVDGGGTAFGVEIDQGIVQ